MKKLTGIICFLILIFSLTSCSNQEVDYTLREPQKDLAIGTTWLNVIEYADTPIQARESLENSGYEIYLPKDLAAASRYTATNIEEAVYDADLFRGIYVSYLSLYSGLDMSTVITQVNSVNETIESAYSLDVTVQTNQTYSITEEELNAVAEVEGQDRCLAVLYLPVLVRYYTARSNEIASHTLTTYALVPVYYEIGYMVNGTYTSTALTAYTQVSLNTSNTLVNDLAE